MTTRYDATGAEAEFESGSRGRALRNLQHIVRVGEMQQAESHDLLAVQEWTVGHFSARHRFVAADVRLIHRRWQSSLYPWAGEYRHVNVAKAGFMFAAAQQVPRLMQDFEQN